MSQTSVIVAALFVGFLVYITSKGQLAQYAALFYGGSSTAPTAGS